MVKGDGDRKPTQEQLRLAQVTQGAGHDDDQKMQKLVKKVIETTRCSQLDAEGALFDNDNNVELAVLQILEKAGTEWETTQKGRKIKKAEPEVAKDQRNSRRTNSQGKAPSKGKSLPVTARNATNSRPPREQRNNEGGRGGGRPYRPNDDNATSSTKPSKSGGGGGFAGEWKPTEKADPSATVTVDEDLTWKNSGPLVFSRREPAAPTAVKSEFVNTSQTQSVTVDSTQKKPSAGPLSFAAAVAAKKAAAPAVAPPPPTETLKVEDAATTASPVPSPSKEFSVSPSKEKSPQKPAAGLSSSGTIQPPATSTFDASASASENKPVAASKTAQPANRPNHALTEKLKNDIRFPSASTVSSVAAPSNEILSFVNTSLGSSTQPPTHPSSALKTAVEFVSGEAPSVASDYQFGYQNDNVVGGRDNGDVEASSFFSSSAPRSHAKEADAAHSLLSQAGVDGNSTGNVSSELPAMSTAAQQYANKPRTALSYDTTSSISYHPTSDGRNNGNSAAMNSRPAQQNVPSSQAQQQQQQQQQSQPQQLQHPTAHQQAQNFYAQLPYSQYAFPFMNMSPAGLRDDAQQQYAASMLHYPFMDMSSLAAMIPPMTATAAPPQASVQSQHHQTHRSDPYSDMKAYQSGGNGTLTSSSSHMPSNGGLTQPSSQQQRQPTGTDGNSISGSSVAPPPGFSGPPSNIAAAFMPQNLNSLFQGYNAPAHIPMSYMMPNSQPKLPAHMFPQQAMDDSVGDMRLSGHQQKIYGNAQQQNQHHDKYSAGNAKDRITGTGAQHTPPPQISAFSQANYGTGMNGQMPLTKKPYGGHQWN